MVRGSTSFFGRGTEGSTTRSSGLFTPRNTTQSTNSNQALTPMVPPNRGATTSGPKHF
jgi:hypothetical protein